jgi:hypothetical protein
VALGPDFIEDVTAVVDPIFTGLLVDPTRLPTVPGLRRPADLARVSELLERRLGAVAAARVRFGTLHTFLRRLLASAEGTGLGAPPVGAVGS